MPGDAGSGSDPATEQSDQEKWRPGNSARIYCAGRLHELMATCAESVGELNASALHVIEVPMQFATGGVERVLLLLGMAAVEQWSSILSRITEQSLR